MLLLFQAKMILCHAKKYHIEVADARYKMVIVNADWESLEVHVGSLLKQIVIIGSLMVMTGNLF